MIKEVKEWFFRLGIVPSGIKRDREPTFNKQYIDGNLKDEYKMFLRGQYPSEDVYKKLYDSVTFKLNPEDTAFETQQGLVQKCTDSKSINRNSTDNGCYESDGSISGTNAISQDTQFGISPNKSLVSTNYTTCVLPHQLPNILTTSNQNDDGTNSSITSNTGNGITITELETTLTSPLGRKRKNFLIEVEIDTTQNNLEFDINGFLRTKGFTGTQSVITSITVNAQGQVTAQNSKTITVKDGIITNIA